MITFTEIEEFLTKLGIGRAEYRINETPIDGTPCIQYDGKATKVFTTERGIRFDLQTHDDPIAGKRDFIERVLTHHREIERWTKKQ